MLHVNVLTVQSEKEGSQEKVSLFKKEQQHSFGLKDC